MTGTAKAQTQTALGAALAPPVAPSIGLVPVVVAAVGGFFMLLALYAWAANPANLAGPACVFVVGLMFGVPAGAVALVGRRGRAAEVSAFQRAIERWRASWYCCSCGHVFIPGATRS